MRFKTDENLSEDFAHAVREAAWDALSVVEQRLSGSSDPRIAEICIAESRTLIALDNGFANIKAYRPGEHAGIIALRPARQDKASVLSLAGRLIDALRTRKVGRELWMVDERKVRIRS